MNFMHIVLSSLPFTDKNKKLVARVDKLRETIKKTKFKVDTKSTLLGDTHYYNNVLPLINKDRDVLRKPNGICKIRVNWKKKNFAGMSVDEVTKELKTQYGWNIATVDAEHTRNKFKNKTEMWVVFDTEKEALRNMELFNSMFMTAIELDCIEEYRRFKENPAKRPLTFDKLVDNAYDLYDLVDKGEL